MRVWCCEKRARRMNSLSDNDVPISCAGCGTEDEISSNKKECTSCEQKNDIDGASASCELLNGMTISDDMAADTLLICANCGKEGSDVTNTCNKCKMVMYCNAACKKKHRHKHKKECERIVSELHDEALFKQPSLQYEECPICFLRMPSLSTGCKYKSCCGKIICSGCIHAVRMRDGNIGLCPFCRTPIPKSMEETMKRMKKRIDAGDADAIQVMGSYYYFGWGSFAQDYTKALEYWYQAAEHGHTLAHFNIGTVYDSGRGVEIDKKKAKHYYELAAVKGDGDARNALGVDEENTGNMNRAIEHFMIAASDGFSGSLDAIKKLYMNGHATKDDYTAALQGYQEYLSEVRSAQRDEAAAFDDDYKYY